MIFKIGKLISIGFVSLVLSNPAKADNFSTDRLFEAWMTDQCVEYCFVGICVFLRCSAFPPSCWLEYQPRIEHYWPDFLVTVQNEPDHNPYNEFRAVMSGVENTALGAQTNIISSIMSGGSSDPGAGSVAQPGLERDKVVLFKEANVIGNPVLLMSDVISQYTCPTRVKPFIPYYSSALDAFAWRTGLTDMFTTDAWLPGRREIGSRTTTNIIGNSWGAVQPRQGFVVQTNDVKASGVIAQRAVDIVLAGGGAHLYMSPNSRSFGFVNEEGDGFSADAGVNFKDRVGSVNPGNVSSPTANEGTINQPVGSNEKTAKWQMVSPKQDNICRAFGTDNQWFNTSIQSVGNYNNNRDSGQQKYAYNYWQQYSCCWPNRGRHLTTIPVPRTCLTFGSGGSGGSGDNGDGGSGGSGSGSNVGSQVVAGAAAAGAAGIVAAGAGSSVDSSYQQSTSNMHDEHGALHRDIERVETQILVSNQRRDALHDEYTRLYNSLPGLNAQRDRILSNRSSVNRSISNTHVDIERVEREISETSSALRREQLTEQRDNLLEHLEGLEERLSVLNRQLSSVNHQINTAERRLAAIPGEIQALDQQIERLHAERAQHPY